MRRKKAWWAAVIAVLLGGMSVLATASPATAAACGAFANNQIGWGTAFYAGAQPAGGIEGSSSYIYTEPVSLCTTDTRAGYNFSTSWNMVYGGGNGNYAQSGLMYRYGYGCIQKWAEQSLNGAFADWYAGCSAQGERHAYRNLSVYTGGQWHVQSTVDGVALKTSTWSPFGWPTPRNIAFTGETYYGASNVMGTPSKKTAYTGMGVQRYDNDQLVTTCGHAYLGTYRQNNAGRYGVDSLDCSYVRTWTN